jgi:hypothetical protein
MDSNWYEIGVGLCLVHWLFQSVWLIILLNSRLEKNLNKVSQRLSWSNHNSKLIESRDEIHPKRIKMTIKYLFIIMFNFCFIFLSWITLFYIFLMMAFNKFKRDGEPEVVKNLRWKLRNLDLSYEQILEGFHQIEFGDLSFKEYRKNYEDKVKCFMGED